MERPTLDRLAQIADALVDGRHPELTYIGEDTVKRRVGCGAAASRSPHDEVECIAMTLLESAEASDAHRAAGVRLSGLLAAGPAN